MFKMNSQLTVIDKVEKLSKMKQEERELWIGLYPKEEHVTIFMKYFSSAYRNIFKIRKFFKCFRGGIDYIKMVGENCFVVKCGENIENPMENCTKAFFRFLRNFSLSVRDDGTCYMVIFADKVPVNFFKALYYFGCFR